MKSKLLSRLQDYFQNSPPCYGWYPIIGELKGIQTEFKDEIHELKASYPFLLTLRDIHDYLIDPSEDTISLLRLKKEFIDQYMIYLKEHLPHESYIILIEVCNGFEQYIKQTTNTKLDALTTLRQTFIESFKPSVKQ